MAVSISSFKIIQERIASKTGDLSTCEDRIHLSDHFIAVIDGGTSKSDRAWDEGTPGQVAAALIAAAFDGLPDDATISDAVNLANNLFMDFYAEKGFSSLVEKKPHLRLNASLIAFSMYRKELWLVGDCQGFIGADKIENPKKIDSILSYTRSVFLEAELASGGNLDTLRKHDIGREYIFPLLVKQSLFQNNPSSQYGFSVIDGFPVPQDFLITRQIPTGTEYLVLASDGYPLLFPDLEQSEEKLRDTIQKDPLMFRLYPSTKGVGLNAASYDDRAFVKIQLDWS